MRCGAVSVRPSSVCLSVTLVYCVETTELIIKLALDCLGTVVYSIKRRRGVLKNYDVTQICGYRLYLITRTR